MIPHDRMETVPLTPRDPYAAPEGYGYNDPEDADADAVSVPSQRSTYLSFFRSPRAGLEPPVQSVPGTPLDPPPRYRGGEDEVEDDDGSADSDSAAAPGGYLPASLPRPRVQPAARRFVGRFSGGSGGGSGGGAAYASPAAMADDDAGSVYSSISVAYAEQLEDHLSQISSQSHLFGEPLLIDEAMAVAEEVEEGQEYPDDLERGGGGGVRSSVSSSHHTASVAPRYEATPRGTDAESGSNISNGQPPAAWLPRLPVPQHPSRVAPLSGAAFARAVAHRGGNKRSALSPRSQSLQDLGYLRQQHDRKISDLAVPPPEHYDFCLVLQPQNVYGYWAKLLDFRQEFLGEEAARRTEEDWDRLLGLRDRENRGMDVEARPGADPSSPVAATPTSAQLRRRRNGFYHPMEQPMTPLTTSNNVNRPQNIFTTPGFHSDTSIRCHPATTARKSVFERAMGSPTASDLARASLASIPSVGVSQMDTPFRRRWGASLMNATPSAISPPIRSLTRGSSAIQVTATSAVKPRLTIQPEGTPTAEAAPTFGSSTVAASPRDPNEIRLEDIPPQRFARGIAARTNGMLPFLSALRRGIVLRKHRPGQEAVFCRLFSDDGGDTIRYTVLTSHEEAMNAFNEQRVRYNKVKYSGSQDGDGIDVQPWSMSNDDNEKDKFSVPDYVAAQRYREKLARERQGLGSRVQQLAASVARVGCIRAADIAVVHPGVFNDPRSDIGELGTTTFRRSRSPYNPKYAFSLVMRHEGFLGRAPPTSIDEAEGKWLSGEGNETQFKYHDFETATLGEYWLIFRGFLLLHRDAAVGRFAAKRAAGIGSHYNRLEMEQRAQTHDDDHNMLNRDAFYEPKTAGYLERMIVKHRGLDATYLEGYTQPGAVPPPSDYFLGFRSPGTAIWSRLRFAGLETFRIYSLDPNRVMIKIRCPPERMLDVAEVLRVKLKTKDGSYAPFREDMMDIYQSLNDMMEIPSGSSTDQYPFRSSIRNKIIDFIVGSRIRDSGAELAQNTELGKMILARVPLHMRSKLDLIFNNWFYFWRLENWREKDGWRNPTQLDWSSKVMEIQKALTMNTASSDSDCDKEDDLKQGRKPPRLWKRIVFGSFSQPLDSIEQYFGEKVAFYFAWLQHTATHLVFLSIIGLFMFVLQLSSGEWDHPLRPLFSVVIMLWTFLVLINWKKRANLLAYQWGTLNYKQQEVTRPQFQGEYTRDEVTGEWVVMYPRWKRWLKYLISVPLTLLFTFGALIMILWVHANRDLQLDKYYNQFQNSTESDFKFEFAISAIGKRAPVVDTQLTREQLRDPAFWFIIVGMPSMLGLFLPLLNLILMKISVMLNDFENYRTESEYRTWLIIKVFSFRFVCYFATLYYYAFISIGSEQAIENGILRVASGVLVYTTVAQWWQTFLHVCFPMFIKHLRMRHRSKRLVDELREVEIEEEEIERLISLGKFNEDLKLRQIRLINKRLLLHNAQDDVWLEVMNPMHDSFPEYIQAVVQFTFCSCFSVVLPITPLICLLNYLISMRLDAYKLCKGRRRPLAEKTGGIGIWEHLMHIVAVISVLTNCWLMGFTTSTFTRIGEKIGQLGLFALVVGWEHLMLLIKYVMQTSMSPLPRTVRDAIKREQYELDKQKSSFMRARRLQHQRDHDAIANEEQPENISMCGSQPLVAHPKYSLQTIPSEDQDEEEYFVQTRLIEGRPSASTESTHFSGTLSVD